jgi:hypothetical protein
MNQARRESLEVRLQKRRDYLQQRSAVEKKSLVGLTMFACGSVLTAVFVGVGLSEILVGHPWGVPYLLGSAAPAALAYAGGTMTASSRQRAASLRYVPPVDDSAVDLPAEDVLLRGASSPVVAAEELLRPAADVGIPSPPDELLRPL